MFGITMHGTIVPSHHVPYGLFSFWVVGGILTRFARGRIGLLTTAPCRIGHHRPRVHTTTRLPVLKTDAPTVRETGETGETGYEQPTNSVDAPSD